MTEKKIKYASDHPLFDIHSYDIDVPANHIYLFGHDDYAGSEFLEGDEPGVEYTMANRFIRNLNILRRNSDKPILIHMKTCGGEFAEGMAIYDTIKSCPNHVTILSYTHARSMSSLIFQAADKRVMMPHSTFMFHDGTMATDGTIKQFLNEADEIKKYSAQMMKIYIDVMKQKGKFKRTSRQKIYDWLRAQMDKREEVYLDAAQAIQYGFADEIFDGDWDNLLNFDEEG